MCKNYCYFESFSNTDNKKLEILRRILGIHTRTTLLYICRKVKDKAYISPYEKADLTIYGFDKDEDITVEGFRKFINEAYEFFGKTLVYNQSVLELDLEDLMFDCCENFTNWTKRVKDLCQKAIKGFLFIK